MPPSPSTAIRARARACERLRLGLRRRVLSVLAAARKPLDGHALAARVIGQRRVSPADWWRVMGVVDYLGSRPDRPVRILRRPRDGQRLYCSATLYARLARRGLIGPPGTPLPTMHEICREYDDTPRVAKGRGRV